MAAQAKYQVFISSTYEDLRDERDQVIRAVLEMGHIPVGMEMFSAADEEQWQIIARHIDESDYYVVIAAHRYGSLTPDGVSYTRKEYEYARSRNIPVLGFLIDPSASWPADRVDTKTSLKNSLDDFKSLIRQKPVSSWMSADDLHGKFSIALMKAITASPRPGWVRATEVSGPEVTAELIRLSSENATLRAQVGEAKNAAAQEHLEVTRRTIDTLFGTKRTPSYRYRKGGEWQSDGETSLFRIYSVIAPELMVECSLKELAHTLAMTLRTNKDEPWDIVAFNQMKGIMADFMTLDLVAPSGRRHPVSDENEYWSLTPFGLELLKRVRQINLQTDPSVSMPDSDEDASAASDDVSTDTTPGADSENEGTKPAKGPVDRS